MKYIDADKLIAEIERLCAEHTSRWETDEVAIVLDKLEDFIISLQQEQPEMDWEKEYKEYVEDDPVYSKLVNGIVGKSIARHFYELGLNARKE